MKKINIELKDDVKFHGAVFANNQLVKFKKKNGTSQAVIETETDEFEIKICKYYAIQSKCFLLEWFLYYVIGIFGIFAPRNGKRFMGIDYVATVKTKNEEEKGEQKNLNLEKIKILINPILADKKAVTIESSLDVQETKNIFFAQPKFEKRAKTLRKVGFLIFLIFIVVLIFLI